MHWHAYLRQSARRFAGLLACAGIAFLVGRANAGSIPEKPRLTYTGVLEDGSGKPLMGRFNIEVKLWRADTKVTQSLCTTNSVSRDLLENGRFSIELPEDCRSALREHDDVEVEVLVDGEQLTRQPLGVLPYALEAEHATSAETAQSTTEAAHCATADHAQRADTATHAETAANALTKVEHAEIVGSDPFGEGCFANLGAYECSVATERKCRSLGFISGWFVGEWGSTGDGNSRTIVCIR